jgi:Fe-S cluster biogenesis protein NfuA
MPGKDGEFQSRAQELERLLQSVEQIADPRLRQETTEIVQALLQLHGEALARMLNVAANADADLPSKLADDSLVGGVLLIHGLHPLDLETRVRRALEKVKPYLASHGGHVELLSVNAEGHVHLRLDGSCHGCPSSRVTLQNSIEQEIYTAAPDVVAIEVDGLVEEAQPSSFVPVAINGSAMPAAAS